MAGRLAAVSTVRVGWVYSRCNRELMAQASTVRVDTIFLNSNVGVSRESVEKGRESLATFRVNVKTVLAAIRAGGPVEGIELAPMDPER